MDFGSVAFWAALGSIVLTNVVLSGDNAVVIALAARALPVSQQRLAIVWGSAAAVALRVLLTLAAVRLLEQPYLKLAGGLLLLYIGVQLLLDEEEDVAQRSEQLQRPGLLAAVRTILVADVVMSLDNVLAVAAAARGSVLLLALGLGLSIPLIVFGSGLLLGLMQRAPVIITLGGALLGWLAGGMLVSDSTVAAWLGHSLPDVAIWLAGAIGAGFVVLVSRVLRRRAGTA